MDSDEANNTAYEAVAALNQINALYQDVETILSSNQSDARKLSAIAAKNRDIGQITAEWV